MRVDRQKGHVQAGNARGGGAGVGAVDAPKKKAAEVKI